MAIDIDVELAVRGCNPIKDYIIPDDKLEDLVFYLSHLPMTNKRYQLYRMKIDDILKDGRAFLDRFFKIHKVPYIKFYTMPITKTQYYTIKNIHPYKLPLTYVKEDTSNGEVNEFIPPERDRILFRTVGISDNLCELSSSSYVHEIVHTQLDSIKGSYKNFYNNEVFSIFLELIHAQMISTDENVLRVEEINRFFELGELSKQQIEHATGRLELPREELVENSKYINSDLIALTLFYKYYYAMLNVQKEMLQNVQKVFDGEWTVEDYLAFYDVSFENSQDKEKYKKYVYRML